MCQVRRSYQHTYFDRHNKKILTLVSDYNSEYRDPIQMILLLRGRLRSAYHLCYVFIFIDVTEYVSGLRHGTKQPLTVFINDVFCFD